LFPAIKLKPGDKVIGVENYDTDEFSTMFFVTQKGMCLNANKDEVPVQGRFAGGVKGIILNENDKLLFATQHTGEGEVIVVTTLANFKRVISSTIDILPRARKGVIIADIKGKGEVLFADYVTVPYKLAIINSDKSITELETEEIAIENRVTKGKPIKGKNIAEPVAVYAQKHKTEYEDGNMQIRF